MLQNPSKYHPNPLSHFLALHNSQAAHNARNNGSNNTGSNNLANATAFGLCGSHHNSQFTTQNQQQQQQHQQKQHQEQNSHTLQQGQQPQQQQQQQQQIPNQIYNHSHSQQQHTHHLNTTTTHAHQHAQFLDATGTTLDVGKSFTIAAILGLQNRNNNNNNYNSSNNNNNIGNINNNYNKDLTNAINLSLNGNQEAKQVSTLTPASATAIAAAVAVAASAQTPNKECALSNLNSNRDSNINPKTDIIMSAANKFHCDNNSILVNPYLSNSTSVLTTGTTAVVTGSTAAFIASAAHQQHQLHQSQHHPLMASHVRANSFAAAAAVAAVAAANVNAVVNGTPSALQSLQQLHQHHAQQSSLSFARDKLKSENHNKKSSLKNKRVRTIFTPEQLERLEAEFERQQYMVGPERLYLAHTLQLTEAQVKVWFQNRRIKWRKHHLELTQQRLALLRQSQLQTGTVGPNISSLPSPDGLATAASNSSFDENDEPIIKNEDSHHHNDAQRSHSESESELSVCNDSMDADSVHDGGGDT